MGSWKQWLVVNLPATTHSLWGLTLVDTYRGVAVAPFKQVGTGMSTHPQRGKEHVPPTGTY